MTRVIFIVLFRSVIPQRPYCAHLKRKVIREKQSPASFAKKQNAKHYMEKLCEKKKQHHSSMMPLLRQLEAIL